MKNQNNILLKDGNKTTKQWLKMKKQKQEEYIV